MATGRGAAMPERLSKRSILQFLLLVAAVLFCLFLLIEIMIHARPHVANILNKSNSMLRLTDLPRPQTLPT
jgi:hypothetical protein